MVVEGAVRGIPIVIKGIVKWARFKSESEVDLYVLKWYFVYRLITFSKSAVCGIWMNALVH